MKKELEIVIKRASIKDTILAEFDQFDKIKAERIKVVNQTSKSLCDKYFWRDMRFPLRSWYQIPYVKYNAECLLEITW